MQNEGVIRPVTDVWTIVYIVTILVSGIAFIMWLADQITAKVFAGFDDIFYGILTKTNICLAYNEYIGNNLRLVHKQYSQVSYNLVYAICFLDIAFATF